MENADDLHNRFEGRYGVVSEPGGRELNEDSCVVRDYSLRRNPKYLCFVALADGMGGHQAGDVASQVAVEMLESLLGAKRFKDDVEFQENAEKELWNAFSAINSHIYDLGQTSPERKGMGTTLTCMLIDREYAYIGHVGDSRAYLATSEGIEQITEDHSVVGKMLSDGVLTERQAQVHEKRNVLTRAIGPEPNVEIDILKVPVREGEMVFFCSDGLYAVVEKEEMVEVLLTEGDLQTACRRLVDLAIARGTDDNISAIAWRVPLVETMAPRGVRGRLAGVGGGNKFPNWAVALIVALVLMTGFGIGWSIGSIWNRDEGIKTENEQTTPLTEDGEPDKGEDSQAFAVGDVVEIKLSDSGSQYQLRAQPERNSSVVARLDNGCRLKVVSGDYEIDSAGDHWYHVVIVDPVEEKDKSGYALFQYLVKSQAADGG